MIIDILERVWSADLEVREVSDLSPLAQILTSLLAAPTLGLVSKTPMGPDAPFAIYGGQEIMPAASLADVLFEEHGIEVDDDTVVYVEPLSLSEAASYSSEMMGQSLGNILVALAQVHMLNQDSGGCSIPAMSIEQAGDIAKHTRSLDLVQ